MSDAHPVRTGIIGATVGGLLVALILWAVGFLGAVGRGLWSAVSWLGHQLASTISLPVWLLLLAAGYAIAVTVVLRKRRRPPARPSTEQRLGLRGDTPQVAARELDRLHIKIMRRMADADGDTPTIDDLAEDLEVSRLRIEQSLEELEAMGYLVIDRRVIDGPVVDVTRAGRDYLIAKGLV